MKEKTKWEITNKEVNNGCDTYHKACKMNGTCKNTNINKIDVQDYSVCRWYNSNKEKST